MHGGTDVRQDVHGGGTNTQVARGATNIDQRGSWTGENNQTAVGDQNRRNTINQDGGWFAHNNQQAQGGNRDDTVKMEGGWRSDNFTYNVTGGRDRVTIDGGGGWGSDSATINGGGQNFTIVGSDGKVLYQQGQGGSRIEVSRLDNMTVNGADGQPVWRWNVDTGGQNCPPR